MISNSTIIEELFSTSKSGAMFYHTKDGKYILKTISTKEYKFLKQLLPKYYRYLLKNKFNLLPKFFGCYKLVRKYKHFKECYRFITMENVFKTTKDIQIKFDLKGSMMGREVLNKLTDEERKQNRFDFALKDLDLIKLKQNILVGDKRESLMHQIYLDSEFLRENGVIDYSLLVGIHRKTQTTRPEIVPKARYQSELYTTINPLMRAKEKNLQRENQLREALAERQVRLGLGDYEVNEEDLNDTINEIILQENAVEQSPFVDTDDGGIASPDGNEIYFIGIIDMLTEFTAAKSFEYLGKLIINCNHKMSCVPPKKYQERFLSFLSGHINK
jgi:1-phosphatidylinositol-4-phosphate 5-kinase